MLRLLTITFLLVFFGKNVEAQFSIQGQVNLSSDWQPRIYMAQISKLSDYYRTSSDMIITKADVEADGSFHLKGESLPSEPHFYRLYLMKTQNTDYDACLYVGGDDHNFAHILLKNGESLEIKTDATSNAPFGKYEIIGNEANTLMDTLSSIIFPSFYFNRLTFPTELKNAENQLQKNLKNFSDTCSNTLVALAAINNTDFDEYFDRDFDFYKNFETRLKRDLPNSIYTKNYLLKMKYYANEDTSFPAWAKWLLVGLGALSLLLGFALLQSRGRIKNLENQLSNLTTESPRTSISLEEVLTQKEKEILLLISEGKSNKEIATTLFVELSTVKSHINRIYSKIGASNRKEAQALAKEQF